jgi:hypothetical protein
MWQPGGRLPKPLLDASISSPRDKPVRVDSRRSKRNSCRCRPTKSSIRQLSLPGSQAQAAADLLLEQHRALRGPQQQQRVDHRQIDAFVVEVAPSPGAHSSPLASRCGARRRSSVGVSPTTQAAGRPAG